jgi:hypothetical protein
VNYRSFFVRVTGVLVLAACSTLAGCGAPGATAPATASAKHVAQSGVARAGSAQTLYVASEAGVAAFNTATYALERTYGASRGVNYPQALAEDTAGNLYVASPIDNDVVEFAAGTTTTLQTFSKGLHGPNRLAFDPSGNLYVLNGGSKGNGWKITVYSPDGSLLRTITHDLSLPVALAFDSAGNLYVANQGTDNVTVYDGGLNKVSQTIASGLPNFVMVDKSDDVYVVACGKICIDGRVIEYAPHAKRIIRTITKELRDPRHIALDSQGNLFVAQSNAGDVKTPCRLTAYAPGQTQPYETITDGVHGSTWVAIDASDNAYLMNSSNHCDGSKTGNVPVYPDGATMFVHRFQKPIVYPVALLIGS